MNKLNQLFARSFCLALAFGITNSTMALKHNEQKIDYDRYLVKPTKGQKFAHFSGAWIGDEAAKYIAQALDSRTIEELQIRHTKIGDKGAHVIVDALKRSKKLKKLEFSDNNMGDEAAIHLAKFLESNNTLQELRLSNKEGPRGFKALADALRVNKGLNLLRLRREGLIMGEGDEGFLEEMRQQEEAKEAAKYFAEVLESNNTLKELTLSGSDDAIQALARGLRHNKGLITLHLYGSGNEGAKAIGDALRNNNTLQQLYLNFDKIEDEKAIGDEGARAIAQSLEINNSLKRLNLSRNRIGNEGVKAIARALEANKRLTVLNLGDNRLGAKGAKSLADALKINNTLRGLGLSINKIADEGTKYLAEALASNHTLTTLLLGGNEIGNEGAKYLAKALKSNNSLRKLVVFRANIIGDAGAKYIADALEFNRALKDLDFAVSVREDLSELLKQRLESADKRQ